MADEIRMELTEMDNEALQVFNTKLPAHNLKFDENKFKLLLANCISLSFEEKMQVIQNVSFISQFQVDQLMKILQNEIDVYNQLVDSHQKTMRVIEEQRLLAEESLEKEIHEKLQTQEDRMKIEELRKSIEET